MQQQKEDDDATPKIGGSRWKSGRTDKGNIHGYAKDVHEKIKRSEQRIEAKRNQQAAGLASQTTGGLDFAALNKHQPVGMGSENRQQRRQQPEQMPIQGMKTTVLCLQWRGQEQKVRVLRRRSARKKYIPGQ